MQRGRENGHLTPRERDVLAVLVFLATHSNARGTDPPEAEVGCLTRFIMVLQVWAQQGPVVGDHGHHGQHSPHQDEEEGHTNLQCFRL